MQSLSGLSAIWKEKNYLRNAWEFRKYKIIYIKNMKEKPFA
jgi:hypothetical protein